jgi:hypothetical protein
VRSVVGGHQGGFELTMKAFNHTIGSRMVSSCPSPFASKEIAQPGEKCGLKLSPTISSYDFWSTETSDPVEQKGANHRLSTGLT